MATGDEAGVIKVSKTAQCYYQQDCLPVPQTANVVFT